jgi:5-methylcytosine-specific restriction endonuclease McrA
MKDIKKILKEDVARGKPAIERSKKWPAVRNKHLKLYPTCEACGSKEHVQVHHIKPFHMFPELELEPTNLITLCEKYLADDDNSNDNHHLKLGHGGDFKKYEKNVLKKVNEYRMNKSKLGKLKNYDLRSKKKKL